LDCDVCNLGWNESALCERAHRALDFFSICEATLVDGLSPLWRCRRRPGAGVMDTRLKVMMVVEASVLVLALALLL
jgi:hypothetical protein